MRPPELSIIIVNYNVKDLLLSCLKSIQNSGFSDLEVIIVDNNSSDGSNEAIKSQFPQHLLIENNFNAGFPGANNQALRIAKGNKILLLNPDTEIVGDALQQMVSFADQHELCVIAPALLNSDRSLQFSVQPFIKVGELVLEVFFLQNLLRKKNNHVTKPFKGITEVEAVSGAAMLMKREVIEKIGMLDEDLFWTEDMEFCYRANLNGIKRYYLPEVKILHHIGQSGAKNPNVMISNQVLTKINYFRKNHNSWVFRLAKFSRFLQIISRIFIFKFLSLFKGKFKPKSEAYLFTFNRFIKGDY